MDKKLAELLGFVLETMKETKNFTLAQAPDVIRQFIQWQIVESIWTVIICSVGLVVIWKFLKWIRTKEWDNSVDADFAVPITHVIGIISAVALLCVINFYVICGLKAVFSPKVFIIEKVSHLLNPSE